MRVSSRPATPQDTAFLADCFLQAMVDSITASRGRWDDARERSQFEQQLVLAGTRVIQLDGVDVGFIMCIDQPTALQIHTLCVVPGYQGRGIGSHITTRVVSDELQTGRDVVLSVLKTNVRAEALYRRLGFAVVNETEHHRHMKFVPLTLQRLPVTVRRARLEDAYAIAAIHVCSWQQSYRGIVPQPYLDSLSVQAREAVWQRNLAQQGSETLVAEQDGNVRGWISVGRSRDRDAEVSTGELWAIYIHPEHFRKGIGRLLWDEAEGHLLRAGFSAATLWVLRDNAQAIAFYRSIGFLVEPGRAQTVRLGGADLVEIRLRKELSG
jgi:ribosomal protein S18 acetylase RimI-like enzyme